MNRALKSLLAVMVTASVAAAQTAAPPPAQTVGAISAGQPDNAPTVQTASPVPTPAPTADYAYKSVSPGVAEALSMDRPKFNPPTPTPVVVDEPQDMRTVDKPMPPVTNYSSWLQNGSGGLFASPTSWSAGAAKSS